MDWLLVPLAPDGFLDVRVAAIVCVLATQWLKKYVGEWRFHNLVALAITVAVEIVAVALVGSGKWFDAAWAGVVGASLATFGYELLTNLAGLAGVGPRK